MRRTLLMVIMLTMMGCGGQPEATAPTLSVPIAPTVTVLATLELTVTSTATLEPTATEVPTATAEPTATKVPTAEPTATLTPLVPASEEVWAWRVPVLMALMTVDMITEMDELARGIESGTLTGEAVASRMSGTKFVMKIIAQWVVDAEMPGRQGRYRRPLQENYAAVLDLDRRWSSGEIGAPVVLDELPAIREASERTFMDLMGELRRLGVSQAQIDEFMADAKDGIQ